jgi:signal peptidase I
MILTTAVPEFRHKRRRIPVAMLLSLLVPGLGQVYNTRLRRGVTIFGVYMALFAIFLATATMPPRTMGSLLIYGVPVALVVTLYVFNFFDAGIGAWRMRSAALTAFNRVRVYAVAILALYFINHGSAVLMRNLSAVSMLEIGGTWNMPTIGAQEKLLAWKEYFRAHEPRRGDLAAYERRDDAGHPVYLIGRVVGLPGDRVALRGGRVVLNGNTLAHRVTGPERAIETQINGRSYEIADTLIGGPHDNTPEYVVPGDSYFLLGDNRDATRDSRMVSVGMVPRVALHDLPVAVIGSTDLRRVGTLIQPR